MAGGGPAESFLVSPAPHRGILRTRRVASSQRVRRCGVPRREAPAPLLESGLRSMGVFRLGWQSRRPKGGVFFRTTANDAASYASLGRPRRRVAVRCSTGEYDGWRKKAFGSKPEHLSSTRAPQPEDPIDVEWQAVQRERSAPDTARPSTSGRGEPPSNYGIGLEDSYDAADDTYTPFPGSGGGPAGGTDSVALGPWGAGSRSMAASGELWSRVTQVFVILFGIGQTETEGIYSLRAVTGNEGLPVDTIIAFEFSEDAERYAGLLEATMSRHVPKVCPIESKELLDFCADSGYNCRLEPCGSLLMPPEYNVGMTDWERSLRLRDGKFDVLDNDPELGLVGNGSGSRTPKGPQLYDGPTLLNQAGAYFPSDNLALDELKARLERLLP